MLQLGARDLRPAELHAQRGLVDDADVLGRMSRLEDLLPLHAVREPQRDLVREAAAAVRP